MASHLQSEQLISVYRGQYARGELELDEFDRLVGQALRGGAEADAEWLRLAFLLRCRGPQSLNSVDSLLKLVYRGSVDG